MKTFVFTPSENLCHVDIGQEFQLEGDDRWYTLLERNFAHCIVGRETWWDVLKQCFRRGK